MSNDEQLAVVQETISSVGISQFFEVTTKGLIVTGTPSFDQCEALWETLRTFERSIAFAIGDAAKYIRRRFGEQADQILSAATGFSDSTLRGYEWLADSVPQDVRRLDALGTAHHQKVAKLKLTPKDQKKWLDRAAEGEHGRPWTVSRLTAAIKHGDDKPVTQWVLVAFFDTENARDGQLAALQAKGISCRASERRGEKTT